MEFINRCGTGKVDYIRGQRHGNQLQSRWYDARVRQRRWDCEVLALANIPAGIDKHRTGLARTLSLTPSEESIYLTIELEGTFMTRYFTNATAGDTASGFRKDRGTEREVSMELP